ncbi:unnamed protein product [Phytomonas sp. Hart1]|nr:unnamed protein product [Phytomonas sp. Hart1]|eukprot:CCW71619.1 unnamed protein product [Phytomonas sp. isolate Hart1]
MPIHPRPEKHLLRRWEVGVNKRRFPLHAGRENDLVVRAQVRGSLRRLQRASGLGIRRRAVALEVDLVNRPRGDAPVVFPRGQAHVFDRLQRVDHQPRPAGTVRSLLHLRPLPGGDHHVGVKAMLNMGHMLQGVVVDKPLIILHHTVNQTLLEERAHEAIRNRAFMISERRPTGLLQGAKAKTAKFRRGATFDGFRRDPGGSRKSLCLCLGITTPHLHPRLLGFRLCVVTFKL